MTRPSRTLFRNTLSLMAAQVVSMASSLVVAVVLGRVLGPEHYGLLGFGMAMLSYFSIVVVMGTDEYGTRQIAQNSSCARNLVPDVVGMRLVLAVAAIMIVLGIAWGTGLPDKAAHVLIIQSAGLAFTALMVDFHFQGRQRLGVVALRQGAAAVFSVVAVVALIRTQDDLYIAATIPVAAVGVSVLGIGLLYAVESRTVPIRFRPGHWVPLVRKTFPFAFAAFMAAIFTNLDLVMLGFMRPGDDVGWYSAAARITLLALVAGNLVRGSFFPAMADAFGDADRMRGYGDTFVGVLVFLGAPVAVFGMVFAAPVLNLLFGSAFAPAAGALTILMLSTGFGYLVTGFAAAAVAWGREVAMAKAVAISAGINVVLNFVLIPRFGIEGAAVATLGSQVIVAVILMQVYQRMVTGMGIAVALKPLGAAVLAGVAAWFVVLLATDPGEGWKDALIELSLGGAIFAPVYLIACRFLKVSGLAALLDVLAGRSRV